MLLPHSRRGNRRAWTILGSDRAAEIAEAAVILPALFMLLLSIYWFGRAYTVYGVINHAAREGAQTAAVPACANCNGGGCTWPGSALPCDKVVWDAVTDTLIAANLDPSKMIPSTPNPMPQPCPNVVPEGACAKVSGGQFTICRNVQLNQTASPPVCGVIVSFQYPYQFVLPFTSLNNQRILLKAQVEMRSED